MIKNNTDIGSIFNEYLQKEQQFEKEVEELNKLRCKIRQRNSSKVFDLSPVNLSLNLEKSRTRNQMLLKNLEISRARLRTYASYTPTDAELRQISLAYQNHFQKNRDRKP